MISVDISKPDQPFVHQWFHFGEAFHNGGISYRYEVFKILPAVIVDIDKVGGKFFYIIRFQVFKFVARLFCYPFGYLSEAFGKWLMRIHKKKKQHKKQQKAIVVKKLLIVR